MFVVFNVSFDRNSNSRCGNTNIVQQKYKQMKLREAIQHLNFKRKGTQYCMCNSFLRNKLEPLAQKTQTKKSHLNTQELSPPYRYNLARRHSPGQQPHHSLQYCKDYEFHLEGVLLARKDYQYMLKHLYNKSMRSIADRNLIRRIMLQLFDEEMIVAAGKNFVNQLTYGSYDGHFKCQGSNLNQVNKNISNIDGKGFYMVISGSVSVSVVEINSLTGQRSSIHETYQAGSCFGHSLIEHSLIDSPINCRIQEIRFYQCTMFTSNFGKDHKLHRYFDYKFQGNQSKNLGLVHPIIPNELELSHYRKFQIVMRCEKHEYEVGDKLIEKGSQLTLIIFCDKHLSSDHETSSSSNTPLQFFPKYQILGLDELMRQEPNYCHQAYALRNCSYYALNAAIFRKYVSNYARKQKLHLKIKTEKKQNVEIIKQGMSTKTILSNFFRVRKVRLRSEQRSPINKIKLETVSAKVGSKITQNNLQLTSSFIFIKQQERLHQKKLYTDLEAYHQYLGSYVSGSINSKQINCSRSKRSHTEWEGSNLHSSFKNTIKQLNQGNKMLSQPSY